MINRDGYLQRLISLKHNGRLKIITGIRRCGKSYLLNEIYRKHLKQQNVKDNHIIYIAFDDDKNNNLLNPIELSKYLKKKIKDNDIYYFLLDEVQRVYTIINPIFTNNEIILCKDPNDERAYGFQNVVNSLRMIKNADVYITGSNSKFLSKDIMTEFRDRGDEIYVQPLSFKEIVDSTKPRNIEQSFNEYMMYGGMPLVLSYSNDDDKKKYLNNLFDMTYHRDVEERNNISKVNELETLIKIMANNIGSLTNPTVIENTYNSILHSNLSKDTISKFLGYLEDAFIIKKVNRYDIKGRKQIGATYKYYFTDLGLRNSRLDFLHRDDGYVMENVIYNELIRRGYSIQIGVIDIYENDSNGKTTRKTLETDFIASIGDKYYYVQSAYEISDEKKLEQERKSLIHIDNSFKKIIITKDSGPVRRDEDGIIYLDIKTFLLDENSLDL